MKSTGGKKGKKATTKGANSDDDMGAPSGAGYQNGVYDSDSDDGVSGGLLSKKPVSEKDPFADDSDDDDEIFGTKRKVDAPTGNGTTGGEEESDAKKPKKSGIIAESDSDDDVLKPSAAPQIAADVENLFNSDED